MAHKVKAQMMSAAHRWMFKTFGEEQGTIRLCDADDSSRWVSVELDPDGSFRITTPQAMQVIPRAGNVIGVAGGTGW